MINEMVPFFVLGGTRAVGIRMGTLDVVEVAPHMAPAESKHNIVLLGKVGTGAP